MSRASCCWLIPPSLVSVVSDMPSMVSVMIRPPRQASQLGVSGRITYTLDRTVPASSNSQDLWMKSFLGGFGRCLVGAGAVVAFDEDAAFEAGAGAHEGDQVGC